MRPLHAPYFLFMMYYFGVQQEISLVSLQKNKYELNSHYSSRNKQSENLKI